MKGHAGLLKCAGQGKSRAQESIMKTGFATLMFRVRGAGPRFFWELTRRLT
jgi:hypothetical protein